MKGGFLTLALAAQIFVATLTAGESQVVTPGKVIAWGYNGFGQTNIPATVTSAIQVSGGAEFSLVLLDNFVVKAIPADARVSENDLSAARYVSAGWQVAATIRPDGNINGSAYCDPDWHPFPTYAPTPRTVALSVGGVNTFTVQDDGTVVTGGLGKMLSPEISSPLPGLSNIIAVSALAPEASWNSHCVFLDRKGGIREIRDYALSDPFPGVSGFKAVAAGLQHALALRENGMVLAWGKNDFGQTNVPSDLSNVVAITAGYNFSAALKSNGAIIVWGDNSDGEDQIPPGVSFKAIAAGPRHMLGIIGSPSTASLPALQISTNPNGIRLYTTARMDGLFQLFRSTDLTSWTGLDRFSMAGNALSITNSDTSSVAVFYRLKQP